jgi:hypothetical protein
MSKLLRLLSPAPFALDEDDRNLHCTFGVCRVESIDARKDALMDHDAGASLKSRDEILEYLDAVLIAPVVEYRTEIVHVGCDRLRCEEVAGLYEFRPRQRSWDKHTAP